MAPLTSAASLALLLAVSPGKGVPSDPVRDAHAVLRAAARARRELPRNPERYVLGALPPGGLECGDATLTQREVRDRLRSRSEWLHELVYDSPALASRCGGRSPRRSLVEGLRAGGTRMVVEYGVGLACVVFAAESSSHDVSLCFEKVEGAWYVGGPQYCGPTCVAESPLSSVALGRAAAVRYERVNTKARDAPVVVWAVRMGTGSDALPREVADAVSRGVPSGRATVAVMLPPDQVPHWFLFDEVGAAVADGEWCGRDHVGGETKEGAPPP